jgi:hypothetical protein
MFPAALKYRTTAPSQQTIEFLQPVGDRESVLTKNVKEILGARVDPRRPSAVTGP